MDIESLKHNYDKVRGILKKEYFLQKDIMLDAEVTAFHQQVNPLEDKKFWILKTAVLVYPQKNIEKLLIDNGYSKEDARFIERVLNSTREDTDRQDLGKRLYKAVYSH